MAESRFVGRRRPPRPVRGAAAPSPARTNALAPTLVLIGDNLVWGASYPATAIALRGLSASLLALVRLATGSAVLAPLLRTPEDRRWDWVGVAWAVALGLIGYTMPVYLQIVGLRLSSPALAAILVALEPLLTALIAAVGLREPLPWRRRGALLLAFVGAWATAGFPRPGRAAHVLGLALLMLANLGFAAYNAYGAALSRRVSAPSATAATLLTATLGMLPVWLLSGGASVQPHWAAETWIALAFLALPCTAGAYLGWMWAVTRVPVAVAALFLYLQPVVGVLLSVALTGARPALSFYLGAVAILTALFIGQPGVG